MKREEYEERMKDSKYKELTVTNCDSDKDYVFVSYRGNSWKKVLTEIVYKLQKEYKLRVYFDKEFASETNIWIRQFVKNMDSKHCKACLCFFDEGYVTSYATLLELMHAMNPRSKLADSIYPISFPINWKSLDDDDWNTGLGKDDPDNPGWQEEKHAFEREFKLIKRNYPEVEAYYEGSDELRGCDCKDIMKIIQPKNKREYVDEESYYRQFIVDPLKKKCPGVFEEIEPLMHSVESVDENDVVTKIDVECEDNVVESDLVLETKRTMIESSNISIDENTTLKEFNSYCENVDYVLKLREAREASKKGMFDYFIASLLRGCDLLVSKGDEEVLRKGAYYYCTYSVSNNLDINHPKIGSSQFTWTSNSRKAMKKENMPKDFFADDGRIRSGKLGRNSEIFETLDENLKIKDVLQKYRNEEEGFDTKDNALIFAAWDNIKKIAGSVSDKKGIGELL